MNKPYDPTLTSDVDSSSKQTAVPLPVTERYTLGDEIARGGMGIIYRATDAVLGREVAVKVLQQKYGPQSGVALRFADEARITSQLQHRDAFRIDQLAALVDYEWDKLVELQLCGKFTRQVVQDSRPRVD